jgi:hypothetical protein
MCRYTGATDYDPRCSFTKKSNEETGFMTKKIRAKYLVGLILACIAFLVIPVVISPRPSHLPFFNNATFRDIYANLLMLLLFFLNYYWFIPKLYFSKRYVLYGSIIIFGFLTIILLPSLITGYIPWHTDNPVGARMGPPPHLEPNPGMREGSSFLTQVKHSIFLYIVVVLFSLLLKIRNKLFETEVLKHHVEINSLKSQINPHFLFNTLNNIYGSAIKEKSPATASYILKLSGMMRYVVTETGNGMVFLNKELSYINDYIELQKMRITKNLHLSYRLTGDVEDQKIAPLILIPFIENAFKHGVNPDVDSFINITIEFLGKSLTLVVENQKVKKVSLQFEESGVGIENTKTRLRLLYPNKHYLSINDEQDVFRVILKIELQ